MERFDNIMRAIMSAPLGIRCLTFCSITFCVLLILFLGSISFYKKAITYRKFTPERTRGSMMMMGVATGCLLESLHQKKGHGLKLAIAAHSDISKIVKVYAFDKKIGEQAYDFVEPQFDMGAVRFAEIRRLSCLSIEQTVGDEASHYYNIGVRLSMVSGLLNIVAAKAQSEPLVSSNIASVITERDNLTGYLKKGISSRVLDLIQRFLKVTEPLETGDVSAETITAAQEELNSIITKIVQNYKNEEFRL